MTAPSAPLIYANQDGHRIYIRWLPVLTATTYNVYVADAFGPEVIEQQVAAAAQALDGWFMSISQPNAGVVTVRVTAVNAGAEESVSSNAIQKNLRGAGIEVQPSPALNHRRKTC